MFFKRTLFSLLSLSSIIVVLLSFNHFYPKSGLQLSFISHSEQAPLTGLPGASSEVLVVKIDDTSYAHPQVGLKDADVVYIEQVEGGLTRLAAVFSSRVPNLAGPVRSARISDIELFAQYGKVGFAYSGVQKKMVPVVAAANLYDLGATHFGPAFYINDLNRTPPYAMMVKANDLLSAAQGKDFAIAKSQSMGWSFGNPPANMEKFSSVHISWPASSYDVSWSPSENRWQLTHNGELDVDDSGYVLGPKNFVIQLVSITDSIYHDKVGGITPFSATVGTGKCYLLRNGEYLPCTWQRSSAGEGTTFTDLQGHEVQFDKGQTWFALTSKEPIFTRNSVQDAASASSK